VADLRASTVRVDSNCSATPFKAKMANAEQREKIPASSRRRPRQVIGGPDMEASAVSVRLHHGGPPAGRSKANVVMEILASVKEQQS
jgi:hypothetical protein